MMSSVAMATPRVYPTVEGAVLKRALHPEAVVPNASSNLTYHGGVGGIGVETSPKVYIVFYGSQWSSDPSGEKAILQNFLSSIGGSGLENVQTQYCQGVASGTVNCGSSGQHVTNPVGMLAGTWSDTSVTLPLHPTQTSLANEAKKAAAHFGNTTAASNQSVQYVIATPTGHSMRGFKTQWCAWHDYTSSSYGNVAYTNLPYQTDGGSSCGANFNGLGAKAGITIVEGHEFAETVTDQFPSGGWVDSSGAEDGDKCAWISSGQGASQNYTFPNGQVFPVQSLWSNAFNSNAGGCVLSY